MKITAGRVYGFLAYSLIFAGLSQSAQADPVVRAGVGAVPADLLPLLTLFQGELGGVDRGQEAGPFISGFRMVNWDEIGDESAAPNLLSGDYYNSTVPLGILLSSIRITSGNSPLGAGVFNGGGTDLVVMDNLIFGQPQAVPEPPGLTLLGLGTLGLFIYVRRRW